MNPLRPKVDAALLAQRIEAAPARVQRRLDQNPRAADDWIWKFAQGQWTIAAGGEVVTLQGERLANVEQLGCSCLLTPRCFHLLACLVTLEVVSDPDAPATAASDAGHAVVSDDAGVAGGDEPETPQHSSDSQHAPDSDDDAVVRVERAQQQAAEELLDGLSHLLQAGVAQAGVVLQSALLRGAHRCRAEGLHRAAAAGLRLLEAIRQHRARSSQSTPDQLAADLFDALETARRIAHQPAVAKHWIGVSRRRQLPIQPRRLHGLFAEPVVTRSGFAGATVYLLGEEGRCYTAADVRPGEAESARRVYRGGLEIGPLIESGRELARGMYIGSGWTASRDGRLGRGRSVSLAREGDSAWSAAIVRERFAVLMHEQLQRAHALADRAVEARPADWDLVFVRGVVLGLRGAEVGFQLQPSGPVVRLVVTNEAPSLLFRDNLRQLAFAAGLEVDLIGRVALDRPHRIGPLALAPAAVADSGQPSRGNASPQLVLPASWCNRVCLGFDSLTARRFTVLQAEPFDVSLPEDPAGLAPLEALRRRWQGRIFAGCRARSRQADGIQSEVRWLHDAGFTTGAQLLEHLLQTPGTPRQEQDWVLATALYLRAARRALFRQQLARSDECGAVFDSPDSAQVLR